MSTENVDTIVIVDKDEHPVRIVTDRGIAVQVVANGQDATSMTAVDVMSEEPVTVDADSWDGYYAHLAAEERA